MDFIKSHKMALGVGAVCLVLLVLAGSAFYKLMFPSNAENANGQRLSNAKEVDQAIIEQILGEIKENKDVVSATYNKNIRILKFFIDTTSMKLEDAKKLADVITSKLNSEVLDYYDIEVFLTQKDNKEYPSIGTHAKGGTEFVWSYNGVDKDEEK